MLLSYCEGGRKRPLWTLFLASFPHRSGCPLPPPLTRRQAAKSTGTSGWAHRDPNHSTYSISPNLRWTQPRPLATGRADPVQAICLLSLTLFPAFVTLPTPRLTKKHIPPLSYPPKVFRPPNHAVILRKLRHNNDPPRRRLQHTRQPWLHRPTNPQCQPSDVARHAPPRPHHQLTLLERVLLRTQRRYTPRPCH